MIVNRCTGNIIARDLSLVASRIYRMAVTWPGVTCRRYIIPLFRHRPPGLHEPYKRKGKEREKKNETIILCTGSYEPISPTSDRYSSNATFWRIRCMGKLHISKKLFRPGGMALSEWTRSVRAFRDTPVADNYAPGVNTTRRVEYCPPIAVSPFLLDLSVYTKCTLYLSHLLISLPLSTISWIYAIAWILVAG